LIRNKRRKQPDFFFELRFKKQGYNLLVGVDEAGRGPLAGPVVAAAVALKTNSFKNRIDDSKKLSSRQRESAFREIIGNSVFGIGIVDEKGIDRLNILEATRIAMQDAVSVLIDKVNDRWEKCSAYILIDGKVSVNIEWPFINIVRGDSRSMSIACASILAKVTRDRIMLLYDKLYPQYGFCKHKGYPTLSHKLALRKFGLSPIHRKSFCHV
jgi:ribonuclease HII